MTSTLLDTYLTRCRLTPYAHQREGIKRLVEQPYFLLADEMGAGKTLQVIVAAQILHAMGTIDRVIVVAPAAVRSVWYDPELGELQKHLWEDLPVRVVEFHSRLREWSRSGIGTPLLWTITNYDFIRAEERRDLLVLSATHKTLLVLDESSYIKSPKTLQTRACASLRVKCGRVILLNGTPIANHVGDLFSQGNMLHPTVLSCPSYTEFCRRYAEMKPVLGSGGQPIRSPRGFVIQQAAGWKNIPQLQAKFAPYTLRRLKTDCLDLPPKLPPVLLTVTLSPGVWKVYCAMRDDLVAWLTSDTVSQAPQIITKIMRLSQITSGFLGGVEEMSLNDGHEDLPTVDLADLFADGAPPAAVPMGTTARSVQEIGREKLEFFLAWMQERLDDDPNFKVIVWSRFRPELARAAAETAKLWPAVQVGIIAGGQKKADRDAALRLLDPRTAPEGPVAVFGNPQSGGLGLNMTAAHHMMRLSQDYGLAKRLQADDRQHRPGQTHPTWYGDIVATGPRGQKTIDHVVLGKLLAKEELATMTTSAWVRLLEEE